LIQELAEAVCVADSTPHTLRLGVLCDRSHAIKPPGAAGTLHFNRDLVCRR
jgi:hypothetical protein